MADPRTTTVDALVSVIETWQDRRKPLAAAFSSDGLREFAEVHNSMARRLINLLGDKQDPEFYSALLELTQQASTLVSRAKFIVEGKDRTNV